MLADLTSFRHSLGRTGHRFADHRTGSDGPELPFGGRVPELRAVCSNLRRRLRRRQFLTLRVGFEQPRSDSNHGCSFGDRLRIVAAHAHRQFGQA